MSNGWVFSAWSRNWLILLKSNPRVLQVCPRTYPLLSLLDASVARYALEPAWRGGGGVGGAWGIERRYRHAPPIRPQRTSAPPSDARVDVARNPSATCSERIHASAAIRPCRRGGAPESTNHTGADGSTGCTGDDRALSDGAASSVP